MTRAKGFSYNTAICCQSLSGFLKQAGNPDQNYRPNKCHNNGTYDAASRPDSQQPKDPAAHKAAQDSENDVHQYAVAPALHNQAGKPTCYQSNHNPNDQPHPYPPCLPSLPHMPTVSPPPLPN